MKALFRAAIALLPLGLSPFLLSLIANGQIDLGAGEKDVIWIFPWVLWSLLYAAISFILWYRGWSIGRSFLTSALIGFGGVLLTAAFLAGIGQLGVGGRF